eukprot:TRINITY_DN1833_c0_g1_i1.p2 TRINITY_DN1833_c0_g1~~TRINITY_DN1833_c0_g1_i1.p2  ORF type:complete len:158 (-),score=51.68 TRINITY_DN1833_c0_g1_i1:76-504(-)
MPPEQQEQRTKAPSVAVPPLVAQLRQAATSGAPIAEVAVALHDIYTPHWDELIDLLPELGEGRLLCFRGAVHTRASMPPGDMARAEAAMGDALTEVEAALAGKERGLGFCSLVWSQLAQILLAKHGLVWLSPQAARPGKCYD